MPAPVAVRGSRCRRESDRPIANRSYRCRRDIPEVGIPIRRGAISTSAPAHRAAVVIVNETFARHIFAEGGGEDPIGRTLVTGACSAAVQIVGIVADVRGPPTSKHRRTRYFMRRAAARDFTHILVRIAITVPSRWRRRCAKQCGPGSYMAVVAAANASARIAQTVADRKLASAARGVCRDRVADRKNGRL